MKVTQNPIPNAGLEKAKATDKAAQNSAAQEAKQLKQPLAQGGAAVDISDQALMMKEARDIVYASPEIRADRVSDLKRRINDGSYKVDAKAVADKLVDEHLANGFGKNDL